ncbi:hypothetical protein FACS1894151_04670 [Spirochaetia bacterium]|nr:hypothetical protein FACS1894151_04670 [Spirochaetia bacterium]
MECALHDTFDLILLDIMLPGMDGYAICRAIRNKINVPILMVTARGIGFWDNFFHWALKNPGLTQI